MSKTVDDLVRVYDDAYSEAYDALAYDVNEEDEQSKRAGIAAVVRALRDETAINSCACRFWLDDILGDAGDEVADTPDLPTRTVQLTGITKSVRPDAQFEPAADPAPAPCLWRVHHETRNGPLYVSQCDGEWRHATADPKCPSCKKEIFFVTDPAPAVCEWTHSDTKTTSSCLPDGVTNWMWNGRFQDKCPNCWKPIKFTEAK